MPSVSQVEQALKYILEERAKVLARQTGCIQRQKKFSGADLVQTLVFGWLSGPDTSLETLASLAATREVSVTDTAIPKRFTKACAQFLHALLEEMMSVVVEASQEAPLDLLKRFETGVLQDSSSVALPDALAESWQGGGGAPGGQAALQLHGRLRSQARRSARTRLDTWSHERSPEPFQRGRAPGRQFVHRRCGIRQLGQNGCTTSRGKLHPDACSCPYDVLDSRRETLGIGETPSSTSWANQPMLGACRRSVSLSHATPDDTCS